MSPLDPDGLSYLPEVFEHQARESPTWTLWVLGDGTPFALCPLALGPRARETLPWAPLDLLNYASHVSHTPDLMTRLSSRLA